jgi:tRNA(Arg) A34 adenosine deaminase TadA
VQPPSPLRIEQPGFLRALYDKWEGRAFKLDEEGLLTRSQDLLAELMGDLHQASFDNIATEGGPFSAAIIAPNGKVIAFGVNRVVPGKDALAHGEVSAYREALANARATEEYRDIEDLSGFILMTSSMTCVSCAEKMAEYGIKVMYFSNTAADIEGNTPFTEGPVRADFWTLTGTRAIHVPAEEDVRLAGFREFCRVIQFDPARSYLEDRSRDGKGA